MASRVPAVTPKQIELLESTVSELRRQSVFAAQLFYCRLFTRRPGLRRLFGGAPDFHGTRLLARMSTAVARLDPALDAPGEGDHAEVIRDALHWMVEQYFRGQLSAEVREAWRMAYRPVAQALDEDMR